MPILLGRAEAGEKTCQRKAQATGHRSRSIRAILQRNFGQMEKTETGQI